MFSFRNALLFCALSIAFAQTSPNEAPKDDEETNGEVEWRLEALKEHNKLRKKHGVLELKPDKQV